MDTLRKEIKDKRDIKDKSINAYVISLKKIHNKINSKLDIENLNWLKSETKVMDFLNELKLPTRKNYIAAVIVALSTNDNRYKKELKFYRGELDKISKEYNDIIKEQQKTEKQENNWTTLAKLRKVMRYYKNQIKEKGLLKKV